MKFVVIATTVLHLALAASIVDISCPDSCKCQPNRDHLETSCASYEFIKKLLPKQESTIVRLNINNASLSNIDLKLKFLKNLHVLDLSHNRISALPSQFPYLPKLKLLNLSHNRLTEADFHELPKNLEKVDLSYNSIATFSKEWTHLKQLKSVRFQGNPIDCDCDNLAIYEQLIKAGIEISNTLTCATPREFQDQLVNTVNCSLIKENLLNSMLGDEAGSGLEGLETNDSFADDRGEFMNAEGITERAYHGEEEVEGSGDEGSGLIPILPIPAQPKACHFNCSTPRPIGIDDEKHASPAPSLHEQAKMIFEDILEPDKVTTAKVPVQEEEHSVKEVPTNLNEPGDKETVDSEVVTFPTNHTVIGEMERASFESSNTQSVYIIVGLLIAFVAFLIIYFINKRKSQRRRENRKRNKPSENGFGEEMKPLGKSAEPVKPTEPLNSKPVETAPLLNGQKDKIKDENHVKSYDENDMEDVELRKPDKLESLTPQPERVTIKAGELPDSVPKTPLLVHRQLNSDGEIVTTSVNSN